jgi:hypothetical protein
MLGPRSDSHQLRVTPDLRLSDALAPKRTFADGIQGRLGGSPIDEQRIR